MILVYVVHLELVVAAADRCYNHLVRLLVLLMLTLLSVMIIIASTD